MYRWDGKVRRRDRMRNIALMEPINNATSELHDSDVVETARFSSTIMPAHRNPSVLPFPQGIARPEVGLHCKPDRPLAVAFGHSGPDGTNRIVIRLGLHCKPTEFYR